MDEFLRSHNLIVRVLVPVAALVIITGLSLLLRWYVYSRLKKLASRTETEWDDVILRSARLATLLWCLFLGVFAAVHIAVVPQSWEEPVSTVSPILLVVMGLYTAVVVVRVLIDMYIVEVARKTASPLDDMIMTALKWIVPIVGAFTAVVLVLDMLDIDSVNRRFVVPAEEWLRGPGKWIAILGLVGLVLVLLATAAIPKVIARSVQRSRGDQTDEEVSKRADTLSAVLVASLQALILSIVAFMMLDKLGLNISAMIAGAGVVGIALGFGAQSLVRDFLSGMFMLIEDQFGVGDVVDLGEATGTVEMVTLRVTR